MQYFIYPLFLILYFELLGRWIFYKFNKKPFDFSFVLGFIVFLGVFYLISFPITVFHLSFKLLLAEYIIVFLLSIFLIVKDFKKIDFSFNKKYLLIFLICFILSLVASWYRTLGEVHGFDTLFYLNIVSNNIDVNNLFSIHPHFGTISYDFVRADYTFQSFYTFASVIIYVFRQFFSIFKIEFETMPAFVWGFQVILSVFYIATTLISVKEIKSNNKLLSIAYGVLFLTFMGSLYYNQVYGFIGNNYRFSILAILSIFLFKYLENKTDKKYWQLFLISLSGLAAVSSTGAFSIIFLLYGLFFVLVDTEKQLIKDYVWVCYVPAINILCTKLDSRLDLCLMVALGFLILYFLNDLIIKIYKNKIVKIATIVLSSLLLMFLSYRMTNNIFDFYAFFNNFSEIADMSFDYFMFNDIRHYIFNPIVLIPLFFMLITNFKKEISKTYAIMILVFFNPFNVTYLNSVNWVYYRAYDIIINQFTLMYMLEYMYNYFKNKKYKIVFIGTVLISSIVLSVIQIPIYYHPSFIPNEDYNYFYKISNVELDLIRNFRNILIERKAKNPKIITGTFYMQSYIPNSSYLFGKEKRYNWGEHYSDTTYQLWLIFFPKDNDYDNFMADNIPLYQDTCELIKKSDYDYIIEDKYINYTFENEEKPRTLLIESCGYKSIYENWKYKVYPLK